MERVMKSVPEPSPVKDVEGSARPHTPGPWTPEPCPCGWSMCHVITSSCELICEKAIGANAHLIAAAPYLLEDCWSLAVSALQSERYGRDIDFHDLVDAALDTCRVARGQPTRDDVLLAKAQGRSDG